MPKTPAQLAGAWFAIFFMALAYEAAQTLKLHMEAGWLRPPARSCAGSSNGRAVSGLVCTCWGAGWMDARGFGCRGDRRE